MMPTDLIKKDLERLTKDLDKSDEIVFNLMIKLLEYGESPTSLLMLEARFNFASAKVAAYIAKMPCKVDEDGWCGVHDRHPSDCRRLPN